MKPILRWKQKLNGFAHVSTKSQTQRCKGGIYIWLVTDASLLAYNGGGYFKQSLILTFKALAPRAIRSDISEHPIATIFEQKCSERHAR